MSATAISTASHPANPVVDAPAPAHASVDSRIASPARLAALRDTGLLDGSSNAVLDRLTRLVTRLLGVPVALVSLVDDRGQHFPGLTGLGGWAGEQRSTPLSHSFCKHVVVAESLLVVEDASLHPLVKDNGAFTELGVVAYAGVPLRNEEGHTLGALCAIDTNPVEWSAEQLSILEDLAAAAMAEIELRASIRALVSTQVKLQAMVSRDELTGLYNRRGFTEQAGRHMALAERTKAPFLVVAIDLNGFKAINDTFGHEAGDQALIEMAALLNSTCRASDILARLGGDEFMLLLTNSGVDERHRVRERLHEVLERRNQQVGIERRLGASIGISVWTSKHPKSLALLQRLADESMYAEKRAWRERQSATVREDQDAA
jgi:diguanylate cyclase (GGDEF)-like protein